MTIKTVAVMLVAVGALVLLGVGVWPLVGGEAPTGSAIPAGIEVPPEMGELRAYRLAYLIDAKAEGVAPLMEPTFLHETMGVEVLHSNEALQRFRQQAPLDGLLIHASALSWLDPAWLPQAYREGIVIVGLDLWFDEIAKLVDHPCIIESRSKYETRYQTVPYFTAVHLRVAGQPDDIQRLEEAGLCGPIDTIRAQLRKSYQSATDALIDSETLTFFGVAIKNHLKADAHFDMELKENPLSPDPLPTVWPTHGAAPAASSYTCNVPCHVGQDCEVKATNGAWGVTYHIPENYNARIVSQGGTFYHLRTHIKAWGDRVEQGWQVKYENHDEDFSVRRVDAHPGVPDILGPVWVSQHASQSWPGASHTFWYTSFNCTQSDYCHWSGQCH